MKKILGIIVLGLLLSGNAYAKSIKTVYKNSDSIIFKVKKGMSTNWGADESKKDKNLSYVTSIAKKHCKSHSKSMYLFGATPHNTDLSDFWYDQEMGGLFSFRARFICANSLEEAFNTFNTQRNFSVMINGDNWTTKYSNTDWKESSFKKINLAKKPKEKKVTPKQSPDDNKVVAASSGTGFIVSKQGHIITNNHVVDSCNTMKVTFNGIEVDAKTLAVDKMNDIAILKANIKPKSIFPVSNDDVSLLEDVVVAGYPLGKRVSSAIKTHKGVVTALAGAGDNYSNFQTDASINQGNSGGPIMNQKGNIVGIAVATWVQEGVQGVHFGIKSSTLKTFANSNSLKFSSPNYLELSNKDLGKLITDATVYLECHMTVAKIKRIIAEANNRKAFFSEYQ